MITKTTRRTHCPHNRIHHLIHHRILPRFPDVTVQGSHCDKLLFGVPPPLPSNVARTPDGQAEVISPRCSPGDVRGLHGGPPQRSVHQRCLIVTVIEHKLFNK